MVVLLEDDIRNYKYDDHYAGLEDWTLGEWQIRLGRQHGLAINHASILPSYVVPLRAVWLSGYFRGAISGLGALNLWIALGEVFRLRRFSPPQAHE